MIPTRIGTALVGLAMVAAACSSSTPPPSTTIAAASVDTTAVSAPEPTTAEQIYELVAPSIAAISTDIARGSGVLIDSGTVLTAAHVVWPYRSVRVVFPNGGEIRNAPVVGWDPFGDLAIIDVAGAADLPSPADTGDGEGIPLGRPVYLVGYPGESEKYPQPTITEGILSLTREWETEEWTFLQSDATVVGGQSGGALVDEDGTVIGITNFSFLEEFGLSGSLADAANKVERMRSGEDIGGLGDRLPPLTRSGTDLLRVSFENVWQDHVFVFESPLYSDVKFTATSDADVALIFATIDGLEIASVDDTVDGDEVVEELITYRGPHLLRIESFAGSADAQLRSSVDLVEWIDPDDGQELARKTTITGNIDYPGDFDWYLVDLGKGQAITIDVDSIAFDPVLMVDGPEGLGYLRALDDDAGGGLFGTNPRIVFTAREAGTFIIVVADSGSTGPGAYRLTVD
ncbi:MAG: serine protease [Actinomycetota bacterium]|nr:serine protease [Actinomycetota bacterium]